MNIALIFAGGTGQRMNTKTKPKQFLELHGKPILVYTLEQFQKHDEIDAIILVMLESWIDYSRTLIEQYHLTKVTAIVPGGSTGQESIYNGVKTASELFPMESVILIHDGVRPLVDGKTISSNIACVKQNGSAITVSPAIETTVIKNEQGMVGDIIERSRCQLAKAPQSFFLHDLWNAHCKAIDDGNLNFIDSACLMRHYGYPLYTIEGSPENIKITTPSDFYTFRALEDARENSQIFG
jgi:2-C-methyl-D-erythritol 4-phosphate cytidylyltransferase